MSLLDALFMEPAPIPGELVRRESPLGPWPEPKRLTEEERRESRKLKDAFYRMKYREKVNAARRERKRRQKEAA